MTAVLQAHSRLHKLEIDTLDFTFDTIASSDINAINEPPESGIYVYGLYCDGFGYNFEKNRMQDQSPGITYCISPIFRFIPSKNPTRKAVH